MDRYVYSGILIAVMAIVTLLLRALPFLIFRGKRSTPPYITYLGNVLPEAAIAMLVVYCLRSVSFAAPRFGLPEIICTAAVVLLQLMRHNSLLSILGGTFLYMGILAIF